MMRKIVLFLLLAATHISCGSTPNDAIAESTTNEQTAGENQSVAREIEPSGGNVDIPGSVTVEFPASTFPEKTSIAIETAPAEESLISDYVQSSAMNLAGPYYGTTLVITAPAQPTQPVTLKYTVPAAFSDNLGEDYNPVLFAKVFQSGANGEELDDFEAVEGTLTGNTLIVELPPYIFTSRRSETSGIFQAVIMLGSQPLPESSTTSRSVIFFSKNSSLAGCNGDPYGSPLRRRLEIIDLFAPRPSHPITHEASFHLGVDLRANDGEDVLAVADGMVAAKGFDQKMTIQFDVETQRNIEIKTGYGYFIVLLHPDGSRTRYAHLQEGSTDHWNIDDEVSQGEVIALADTSGGVTASHLHFEYMPPNDSGNNVRGRTDPLPCLVEPISVISVDIGDAVYWMDFEITFEIQLDVPAGNETNRVSCLINGTEDDFGCYVRRDENMLYGKITLLGARGTADVTIRIRDILGRLVEFPVSTEWDCCESGDAAQYGGVNRSCIALGDTYETTACRVR